MYLSFNANQSILLVFYLFLELSLDALVSCTLHGMIDSAIKFLDMCFDCFWMGFHNKFEDCSINQKTTQSIRLRGRARESRVAKKLRVG